MSTQSSNNYDSDADLDRFIDALRDEPVIEGPSPDVLAKTHAMLREALSDLGSGINVTGRRSFFERLVPMTFAQRVAAVVMITVGGVVIYTLFALFNTLGPTVAYADIAAKLESARTLIFNSTTTLPGMPPVVTRVLVAEKGRMRHEMTDGTISIINGQTVLTLSPRTKTAIRMELTYRPGEEPGGLPDPVAGLRALGKVPGEPIEEKEIGGKTVAGFRSKVGNQLMSIWADKETAMPMRVEMTLKVPQGDAIVVMDKFEIDRPLEDALFSLEPPEGYTLQTQKLEMPSPKNVEEAVIPFLRESAELNDGQFPSTLLDVTAFTKSAKPGDQENIRRLAVRVGVMTAMTSNVEHGYGGKGVKLGEKEKVIFWYRKDPKSPTYRAVFGDLRVEDVTETQLPATRPAS